MTGRSFLLLTVYIAKSHDLFSTECMLTEGCGAIRRIDMMWINPLAFL